jgi:hypothetical protein
MLAAVAVVACALGSAPLRAEAEYPSVKKQMKLDEGMTMEQVRALFGDPDSTDQTTCGAKTAAPWPCRVWNFHGSEFRMFRVWFQKGSAGWMVNSWSS